MWIRLSMVSENMLSVAADIYYGFDVNRSTRQRMKSPGAVRAEVFIAIWEVRVRMGDDKVVMSVPLMRRDKITADVKLSVSAIGGAQEHRAGIGK